MFAPLRRVGFTPHPNVLASIASDREAYRRTGRTVRPHAGALSVVAMKPSTLMPTKTRNNIVPPKGVSGRSRPTFDMRGRHPRAGGCPLNARGRSSAKPPSHVLALACSRWCGAFAVHVVPPADESATTSAMKLRAASPARTTCEYSQRSRMSVQVTGRDACGRPAPVSRQTRKTPRSRCSGARSAARTDSPGGSRASTRPASR